MIDADQANDWNDVQGPIHPSEPEIIGCANMKTTPIWTLALVDAIGLAAKNGHCPGNFLRFRPGLLR
jgi:hypothetical protein